MSRRDSMSRFISLSSTIRILAIFAPSARSCDFLRLRQPQQYPPQRLAEIIGTLCDHLARASGQQLALGRAQWHCCQDDNRDLPPLGTFPDLVEKGETVHTGH